MIQCEKCGADLSETVAYCPACGALSPHLRKNAKGMLFIPLDKLVPTGAVIVASSFVVLLIGFALFANLAPVFLCVGVVGCVVGGMLVVKYKATVQAAKDEVAKKREREPDPGQISCKLCEETLEAGSRYCTFCGSKVK